DIIMLVGGGFLIFKATKEIHHKMEDHDDAAVSKKQGAFWPIIGQILLIDIVFSLDSVITAVGMAQALWVMITAVVISVVIMLAASGPISRYVEKHPTMKMLALSFLILIGVVLVADGLGQHISKGYVYFAMAFSFVVEMLNLRLHRKKEGRHGAAAS
ncbi:MAG: TerC family protein, partial [Phycisphaerales bacterium]